MNRVSIGCGAGFAGDRTDAAVPVVRALSKRDGPRYLIFETLAERTLALAQVERRNGRGPGYNRSLDRFIRPILHGCAEAGIKIVSNFGAANPRAAGERVAELAMELGGPSLKIAIVEGDELTDRLSTAEFAERETDGRILAAHPAIIAANVYLGAEPIAQALAQGADIVVTGRVADPSLALGPLIHAFGWGPGDLDSLAAGTLAGHLLECGSQVTGGYFADPGFKDVPGLADLGYPIAEVEPDGSFVITKPDGTGGLVDRRTVTEQILYEIHDPAAYLTPDVVLDITGVEIEDLGGDRVRVSGARGKPRPERLKATVCIDGGLLAEAEISYAGHNAAARARLAIDIVRSRMARRAPGVSIRADAIGVMSVHADLAATAAQDAWRRAPNDIRIRFAGQFSDAESAEILLGEVEALYCAGPAGGAGVRRHLTPRLCSASCLIERNRVEPRISFLGGAS
ncbi:MAG: acyclic terpene utilization AtuA family protein [Rhodomicrobiaceae bacterium]